MKTILIASIPHPIFNAAVRDGTAGAKTKKILDALKPEAAYFTEINGKRTAILVVNMSDASQIPSLAEPFFLTFEADVQCHPAMTPADLDRAGLDKIGKQWS